MKLEEVGQDLEKRTEPRFQCRFPTKIISDQGDHIEGLIVNISLSGMQIVSNGPAMAALFPNFKRDNQSKPINLLVEFVIPTSSNEEVTIKVHANAVWVRRVQRDMFAVGCEFTEMLDDAGELLTDYIYYFGKPL
ncbi:MAG: PilZ domain-containing protein [Pseudomonadota bacterium]